MLHHTEEDLNRLIEEKLVNCIAYSHVSKFIETETGRNRVKNRIKEIIFNDGIADIDTAIGIVETELIFE